MEKQNLPVIFVTNDDGVNARGIKALIEAVRPFGKIVVVAPTEGQSGMGHAITIKVPLRLKKVHEEDNLLIYSCNGTPADCVKLGVYEVIGRVPDFLVSGINHGSNASISVVYSGTIAGAVEACLYGVPAVGFSLCDWNPEADFTAAQSVVRTIVKNLITNKLPKWTCLNVNIPAVSLEKLQGYKVCHQTHGVWREEFEKRNDPGGNPYYWLKGEFQNFEPENMENDEWALANHYVAVTPIRIDFTDYKFMAELKNWNYNL